MNLISPRPATLRTGEESCYFLLFTGLGLQLNEQ